MKKPNLVIVMADQFRYDCIGVHGNDVIHTPNLDNFCQESVDIPNYYTNCPVCVPSRVTFFTGRYPHSHKIRENHTLPEAGGEMHLFRILKQAGYRIGYCGKNHLLRDEEFINFNYTDLERNPLYPEAETAFHHQYTKTELECRKTERESLMRMDKNGAFTGAAPHKHPVEATEPHIFTSSAIKFLQGQSGEDEPFCLCLSLVQPHAPHVAPEDIFKMYEGKTKLPSANIDNLKNKANRYFVKYNAQRSNLATDRDKLNFINAYYSMVTAVDSQFGRLMDTLSSLGMEDNTIVVFTSDHGEFLFENGMCKKDLVLTEMLLHVPFIIRYPQVLTPSSPDGNTLMEEVDVFPTLLEMIGIENPLGVQGKSAFSYLKGDTTVHKSEVYAEICTPWQFNPYNSFEDMEEDWQKRFGHCAPINVPGDFTKSIRTKNYRYVWYSNGQEELYDLLKDPKENVNLSLSAEYQQTKLELKLKLFEWLALSEDPIDPKIDAKNQKKYDTWRFRKSEEGAEGGPVWLEQIGVIM